MSGGLAARVAGWTRRVGSLAGPLGAVSAGSGESPSGAVLQVELFVGGLWVDITSYVMTRDGSQRVSIRRGQPNESAATDPGSCDFQLNNRDGRFSPRNPYGPYYGQLGRNQPIRVSVPSGNDKSYRFWGEVVAWPPNWDVTGTDVWVDVEAAGLLRRLGQGSSPVGSTMYLAGISPARAATTVAYWPCEDAAGATSVASAIGGLPMAIAGTPTMASYSSFACSDPIPLMKDASFTGGVPTYPDRGAGTPPDYADAGTAIVTFLLGVPSTGATDGQVLCSFTTTGTVRRWDAYYGTTDGGNVGLRGYNSLGSLVYDTGLSFLSSPLNGRPVQISIELLQAGADFTFSVFAQGVGELGKTGASGAAVGATFGIVTSVTLAPQGGLTDTALGHLIVLSQESLLPFNPDLDAYAGETAGTRVQRLAGLAGVAFESVGSLTDPVYMGTQLSSTLLSLIQDAAKADLGILYEQTGALGLGYRTRASMQNQDPALTLSYAANQLSEVPVPLDDDQYTRNDVTVTRTGGSSARSTLGSGPLSVLEPPAGVGRYDDAVSINVELDSDLPDQAGWRMHLGTVDEARYPKISVNLAHPTFTTNPGLRQQVLAVRPGDRIVITGPPTWMPPDNISQLVLGFAETIDHFQHRVTFNCAPESPHQVAVLDSATNGRLDTAGSALTADTSAAATSFNVSTTSGPLWTTNPEDAPLDVRAGGEVMTVLTVGQDLLAGAGSFEAGVAGWTPQDCTFVQSAAQAKVGTYSGRLTVVGSPVQAYVRSASVAVSVGAQYRVSFWAYSVAGYSGVIAAIDWYTGGGGYLSTSTGSATVPAGTWTMITATGTAPATAGLAQAGPTLTGSPPTGETLYIEDAQFVPTTSYLTSPQTFTVVRSVNSVAVAHQAGTDVRLSQPMILAL